MQRASTLYSKLYTDILGVSQIIWPQEMAMKMHMM